MWILKERSERCKDQKKIISQEYSEKLQLAQEYSHLEVAVIVGGKIATR